MVFILYFIRILPQKRFQNSWKRIKWNIHDSRRSNNRTVSKSLAWIIAVKAGHAEHLNTVFNMTAFTAMVDGNRFRICTSTVV